ncbi:MAG: homoserine O-succinyltransferase [Vulcanibacillus sp.]
MPIIIPEQFPAYKTLTEEGLFLMKEKRALNQDIRPLQILILNLMPLKIVTETQLLRLISNSLIQIEVTFIHSKTHSSKNVDVNHLNTFYKTFDDIKGKKFDGMIITGAPVEHMEFEDVDYWDELKEIMDYSDKNVVSTLYICWGAQAGLYHFYNVPKSPLEEKMFGIFEHQIINRSYLVNGFDDKFLAPHSRHTQTKREDIEKVDELTVIGVSEEAGVYIISNSDYSKIFITGHFEYDDLTLHNEYIRDKEKGLDIKLPINYYPENNPELNPINRWRSHANLLFANWLNYYVYQVTDYNLD